MHLVVVEVIAGPEPRPSTDDSSNDPRELPWLDEPTAAELAWLDGLRRRRAAPKLTDSVRDLSELSVALADVPVLKRR
jgi:hypothetical protein